MASRFTIAIPTHNRRETVLLAVRSALMQTLAPEQVIVICDGCTDGTVEALRGLGDARVEPLELPKGPGYAYGHRNRSLELARGERIMWLGDDDLLLPNHLQELELLLRSSSAGILLTPAVAVWPDDSLSWTGLDWGVPALAARLERANTTVMSAVCVPVAAARAAGGWDERMERKGDWDLWKRILDGGSGAAMSSEPTVLNFRATGREQEWPDRVRQNSDWFERIRDPVALASLRPELRAQRSRREADRLAELDEAVNRVAELSRHLQDAAEEIERTGAERRIEYEDAKTELSRLGEVEQTLARVYSGGWWRLRNRLLALRGRVLGVLNRGEA